MQKIYKILIFTILTLIPSIGNGMEIITSNEDELEIRYSPKLIGLDTISINNTDFLIPRFEDAEQSNYQNSSISKIFISENIAVPSPNAFQITKKQLQYAPLADGFLAPIAITSANSGGFDYLLNWEDYSKGEYGGKTELNYVGIARNRHVANLAIDLIRFNSNTKKIEYLKSAEITIKFDKITQQDKLTTNLKDSPEFATTINHEESKNWINIISQKKNNTTSDRIQIANHKAWLKLKITEEGLYRIDASDISNAGYTISAEELSSIKVYGNGGHPLEETISKANENIMNEQEIIVNTNNNGGLNSIIFYAQGPEGFIQKNGKWEHYTHHYSNEVYYLLSWGGEPGKRANYIAQPQDEATITPNSYIERKIFQEDLTNPYPLGSGRVWFGRSYFDSPFIQKLDNLDRSGIINYKFGLAHNSTDNGYFTVSENNKEIIENRFVTRVIGQYNHAQRIFVEASINASELSGDNRSIIQLDYNNPDNPQGSVSYFDFMEIHYPATFNAVNGVISFDYEAEQTGIAEFTINGFSGNIYGFEVTDPANPQLIENKSVTGGIFKFKTEYEELYTPKRYFIASSFRKPDISTADFANLRNDFANTDAIVITHKELLSSAKKFAEYRAANSDLSLSVVTLSEIYTEFSAGTPDITAIRDFLVYALNNWETPPSYVVLWGDGHYDYRQISTKAKNYVPAYQIPDKYETSFSELSNSFSTDDFYSKLIGDDLLPDVMLGRLTIDSPESGDWIVEKIKHYEQNSSKDSWRTRSILVADEGWTDINNGIIQSDGNLHNDQSEKLSNSYIPSSFEKNKIYLVEYQREFVPGGFRMPKVNQDIISTINNNGGLLLNFFGHGNPRVWAHENVLERDQDIPRMNNLDKLFFLTAATCDYGRFDMTDVKSGAEEMLLSKTGGAIGVFSATRIVYSSPNAELNYDFHEIMFTPNPESGKYPTLGEILYKAKQERHSENDQKYFLLGDPTLRLKIPDHRVVIDSINGQYVGNLTEPIDLSAMEEVSISGSILMPIEDITASNFNGNVLITVRDGDQFYSYIDEAVNQYLDFTKHGGVLNRTNLIVENGKFSGKFIIPKDISFSELKGNIFTYGFSDNNLFAKGTFNDFRISGIVAGNIDDIDGPEIDIYLDSREFVEGDVVTNNPELIVDLFDESGINSTGLGIGHKIEAWLNDDPHSIDLTQNYSPSLEDTRRGTTFSILNNLEEGTHKVRVRAWDIFNNFSISEVSFRVAESGITEIKEVEVYPNPMSEYTNIKFRHNAEPPFKAELKIYSVHGQLVRTINEDISTVFSSEIRWDGRDNDGKMISSGAYVYTIEIPSGAGTTIKKSGVISALVN